MESLASSCRSVVLALAIMHVSHLVPQDGLFVLQSCLWVLLMLHAFNDVQKQHMLHLRNRTDPITL